MSGHAGRDEETPFADEPEPWHPPVRCPKCDGLETRFVALQDEGSAYECEACGLQFEVEE